MKFISYSPQATFDWAKRYASALKQGQTIGLVGNLGAGKTQLTKGFAAGLQIKTEITSPTFVIMKVYEALKNKQINKLVHLDAYRLDNFQQLIDIGLTDYLLDQASLVVIEWADKVISKQNKLKLKIIKIDYHPQGRIITF